MIYSEHRFQHEHAFPRGHPLHPEDQRVLDALRDKGSDLTRLHHVEHHLYYRTRGEAEEAVARVRRQGWPTHVEGPGLGGFYLLAVTQTFVPTDSSVAAAVEGMDKFAAKTGAEYGGWSGHAVG